MATVYRSESEGFALNMENLVIKVFKESHCHNSFLTEHFVMTINRFLIVVIRIVRFNQNTDYSNGLVGCWNNKYKHKGIYKMA